MWMIGWGGWVGVDMGGEVSLHEIGQRVRFRGLGGLGFRVWYLRGLCG